MSIVAIQGVAASFHDVAARKMLGDDIRIIPCDTFLEVFENVFNGQAQYGVVATDNSIYGPIKETRLLAEQYAITQCGELELQIEQCLLALPGAQPQDILEVHSNPIALMQCQPYLRQYLPQAALCDHPDTAGSAADVRRWSNVHKAAIASQAAAALYGLQVLATGIESKKDNRTRFIAFQKHQS